MQGPNKIEVAQKDFESREAFWNQISEFVRGLTSCGYAVSLIFDVEGVMIIEFDSQKWGEWEIKWEKIE